MQLLLLLCKRVNHQDLSSPSSSFQPEGRPAPAGAVPRVTTPFFTVLVQPEVPAAQQIRT